MSWWFGLQCWPGCTDTDSDGGMGLPTPYTTSSRHQYTHLPYTDTYMRARTHTAQLATPSRYCLSFLGSCTAAASTARKKILRGMQRRGGGRQRQQTANTAAGAGAARCPLHAACSKTAREASRNSASAIQVCRPPLDSGCTAGGQRCHPLREEGRPALDR